LYCVICYHWLSA